VVILDPRLPEVSDGLALIRRIHLIDPEIRILALGWSPDLEHQAITAGADSFVRKTFKPGDLAAAVARCMGSRAVADPAGPENQPPDPSPRPVSTPGAGLVL
jgi:DNA-binding NarL/FixJ family response regulator